MILPRYSTVFFSVRLSVQPWISLHFSFTSYTIIKHSALSGWLLRLRTMKFTSWNLALNIQRACFLTAICPSHHWNFLTIHRFLKPLPGCYSTSFYSPCTSLFLLTADPTPKFLLSSQQPLLFKKISCLIPHIPWCPHLSHLSSPMCFPSHEDWITTV